MARFLRTLKRNDPEDIFAAELLYDMPDAPEFKCYVVHGDETYPAQIDLYKNARPEYNEKPVAVYIRQDKVLVRQTD